jgi:hypothetical protein
MSVFIEKCPELKGRQDYQRVQGYLSNYLSNSKLRLTLHKLIDKLIDEPLKPDIGKEFKKLHYRKDVALIHKIASDYLTTLSTPEIDEVLSTLYLSTAALEFRLERRGWYHYLLQHNKLPSLLRLAELADGNDTIKEEIVSFLLTVSPRILQEFFSMADFRKKTELIADLAKKKDWAALRSLEPTQKEIAPEEQGKLVLQIIMAQNDVDFKHLSRLALQNLFSKVPSTIAESIIAEIIKKPEIVNAPTSILELSMAFADEQAKESLITILVQNKKYSELCELMCKENSDSNDYSDYSGDEESEVPLIKFERRAQIARILLKKEEEGEQINWSREDPGSVAREIPASTWNCRNDAIKLTTPAPEESKKNQP